MPLQASIAVQLEIPAILESTWDVIVTVNIREAGVVRRARADEVEVKLYDLDAMESPVLRVIAHETPWFGVNVNGQHTFLYSTYKWLVGYDGVWGANLCSITARLLGVTPEVAVNKDFRLGTSTYEASPKKLGILLDKSGVQPTNESAQGFPSKSEW